MGGTVFQAYRFALDPSPSQARRMASFAGASRFAYNAMLGEVKATLTARHWERRLLGGTLTESQGWSLAALRRTWNANKDRWAPWWPEVSKEAFNHGLESLAAGLANWSDSKKGRRKGRPAGFPKFHKRRAKASFAYTTGSIKVLADRHSVQLPRLGRVRTHETTRRLARRLEAGTARIVRATVTREAGGRWHVSFTVETQRATGRPDRARRSAPVVGVDVGVGAGNLLVAATPDGTEVARVRAPKPLAGAQTRLGRLQRKAARQQKGSRRRRRTLRQIGRTHARVANVRRDALHKATTALAHRCDTIVVEDLNVAGMAARKRGLGARGRGFNRAVADASLAEIRRQLEYKTVWYGARLVVADRWYPSTKTCSHCGTRKPNVALSERTFVCAVCGVQVDRDLNAAVNLARLGGTGTGSGPAASHRAGNGRGAERDTDGAQAPDAAGVETSTPHRPPSDQTGTVPPQGEAA